MTSEPVNYKCDAKECIVGTDVLTDSANAISSTFSGIIIIPSHHNGLPVTKVGQSAFRYARSVTEVIIKARITTFGVRAFSDMDGLKKINIPSSVTRIEDYGLQFSLNGQTVGTVTVTFEEGSSLEYIGSEVFGYKTNLIVYYTKGSSPSCHSKVFDGAKDVTIYAPASFKFCNIYNTIVLSRCKCTNNVLSISLNRMFVSLILALNIS